MKKFILFCAVLLAATEGYSQKAKNNIQKKDPASTYTTYTCPMHPGVKQNKPGKCTTCGMELVPKKEAMKQKGFCCAMHPEVTSDSAGTCPKCGMKLTASKKEQMKMKEMHGYKCPMHPDEVSNKPGTCPKCGMELSKKD